MKIFIRTAIALTTTISAIALSAPVQAQQFTFCSDTRHFIGRDGNSTICFDDKGTDAIADDVFYIYSDYRSGTSLAIAMQDEHGGVTLGISEAGQSDSWVVYLRDGYEPFSQGSEAIRSRYEGDLIYLANTLQNLAAEGFENISLSGL